MHSAGDIDRRLRGLLLAKWAGNRDFMPPLAFDRFLDMKFNQEHRQERLIRRIRLFDEVRGRRVLDLGSGEGGLAVALNLEGAEATGLDIKEENIAISRLRAERHDIPASRFVLADAGGLPFDSAAFDIVILNEVLEHVPDIGGTLGETLRVLRPGGIFFARVPNALWPKEGHVDLWFPHWLPGPLRRAYVRAFRARKGLESGYLDEIRYHGYRGWRREIEPFFPHVLPNRIIYDDLLAVRRGLLGRVARQLLAIAGGDAAMDILSPTTHLVARKRQ